MCIQYKHKQRACKCPYKELRNLGLRGNVARGQKLLFNNSFTEGIVIKIIPTPDGLTIARNGVPIALTTIDPDNSWVSKLTNIVKSIKCDNTDNFISFLQYQNGVVKFFMSSAADTPVSTFVYIKNFPIELLAYLRQVESEILRSMPSLATAQDDEVTEFP